MFDISQFSERTITKIAAGLAGALVSVRFIKGTFTEVLLMAFGGLALSLVASETVARWLGLYNSEGMVGFLLGLFGMALVEKVYEYVKAIDANSLARATSENINKWFKRVTGG